MLRERSPYALRPQHRSQPAKSDSGRADGPRVQGSPRTRMRDAERSPHLLRPLVLSRRSPRAHHQPRLACPGGAAFVRCARTRPSCTPASASPKASAHETGRRGGRPGRSSSWTTAFPRAEALAGGRRVGDAGGRATLRGRSRSALHLPTPTLCCVQMWVGCWWTTGSPREVARAGGRRAGSASRPHSPHDKSTLRISNVARDSNCCPDPRPPRLISRPPAMP